MSSIVASLSDSGSPSKMWIKTDSEDNDDDGEEQLDVTGGETVEEERRREEPIESGLQDRYSDIVVDGRRKLSVPSALISSPALLDSLLSVDAWNTLDPEKRDRLKAFLPGNDSADAGVESNLSALFGSENFFFGNPADRFKADLRTGRLRPESAAQRRSVWRAERRQYAARTKERAYTLLEEILSSRKTLLESAGMPSRTPASVVKMERKAVAAAEQTAQAVAERYCSETDMIRSECGGGAEEDTKDEFYPDGAPPKKTKRRTINLLESDYFKSVKEQQTSIPAACKKQRRQPAASASLLQPSVAQSSSAAATTPPQSTSLSRLGESLMSPGAALPKFLFQSPPRSATDEAAAAEGTKPEPVAVKAETEPTSSANERSVVEEAVANIPGLTSTKNDDDEEDKSSVMAAPVKTEEADGGVAEAKEPSPAAYFCLLRDKFKEQQDSKITIPDLEEEVRKWQEGSDDCQWKCWVDSWVEQIPSAVAFLIGAFPDCQPAGFRPYVECNTTTGHYHWIGDGRDGDSELTTLSGWWFQRRESCRAVTTTAPSQQPPTAQAPTSQGRSNEDLELFQAQERERFAQPHLPFTYRLGGGRECVVPPIKTNSSTSPTKVKPHPALSDHRPAHVSAVSLVRDAVARLPRGEGTRAEIEDLTKESQYLSAEARSNNQILANLVSGALDRLQTEGDPCVRYDSAKKLWVGLHRGRSEQDFARIFQERKRQQKKQRVKRDSETAADTVDTGATSSPSVQTIQLMTPQGMKVFRLTGGGGGGAQPSSAAAPVPVTPPAVASQPSTASFLRTAAAASSQASSVSARAAASSPPSLLRLPTKPILPRVTTVGQPACPQPPQQQQQTPSPTRASVTFPQQQQPAATAAPTPSRFVVHRADGQQIHLTEEQVRLLRAKRAQQPATPIRAPSPSPRSSQQHQGHVIVGSPPPQPRSVVVQQRRQPIVLPPAVATSSAQRVQVAGKQYFLTVNAAGQQVLTPVPTPGGNPAVAPQPGAATTAMAAQPASVVVHRQMPSPSAGSQVLPQMPPLLQLLPQQQQQQQQYPPNQNRPPQ